MVFNLQLFSTTWTFDSGVGLKSDNKTIFVNNSNGRELSAIIWDANDGMAAGPAATATAFSMGAIGAAAAGGVSTWGQFADFSSGMSFAKSTGVSGGFAAQTIGQMVGTDGNVDLALNFANTAQGDLMSNQIMGLHISGVSFAQGYQQVNAIQLNGDYVYSGGQTQQRFQFSTNGGATWNDTFNASGVNVLTDLRNNGSNLIVEIDRTSVSQVDLQGYDADLTLVNTFNNQVVVNGLADIQGNSRTITFGKQNLISLRSTDGQALGSEVVLTNGNITNQLVQGPLANYRTNLTNLVITGQEGKELVVRNTNTAPDNGDRTVNFGRGTDSAYIVQNQSGAARNIDATFDDVEYGNISLTAGNVDIRGLRGTNNIVVNAKTNTGSLTIANNDLQGGTIANTNKVTVNVGDYGLDAGETPAAENRLNLGLSGAGVESVNIGTHGANATANNWVMSGSTPTGAVSSNLVSIGDHGILAVEGDLAGRNSLWIATHWTDSGDDDKKGEKGDPSYLEITTKADGSANGANMGSYEYMNIAAQGNTYKAMVVSDDSLKASDTNVNFGVDIVVGDMLNLGDRTDKKVVFLNNGLGKNDWGETVSYSANMTTVKSSTAGGSLIIGDFENSVSLYGAGDQDSLFGGNDYEHDKNTANAAANMSNYDTLASAAKKKAWMGTSEYSGLTMVDLVHNGQQTNNFGFLGENDETEKTGDVLALMHGAAFTSLKGSEHQLVNFAIGADSANHFMFQSVTEGSHDIMYTYDLGKNNYNGRVDTSLLGSKSGFEYDDSIDFYLGFDKGTVLSFDSSDKNQKLNYDGGAVLMGISTIDGAAGGAGNILNGQENHAEYIVGSATAANTLCGGLKGDADTAADTLVGGSAADTFWVGATMGNDVINNVSDGDTIVFLNSKFADATITHNMLVPGDASVYNVSFSDEAGGATVNLNTATGKKLSDFKSLTIKFDDATYAWNGTEWSQS